MRYWAEPDERWDAGGERLLIRPIRPAVAAEHNAFFHRLSPKDIRLRFFATVRELTPAQLDKFTRLDYDRDMALIAIRKETGERPWGSHGSSAKTIRSWPSLPVSCSPTCRAEGSPCT
jgi:hypothetical protein